MKKKMITLLAGTMLVSSVSFAAPLTDLQKSETAIGYNHYNLDGSVKNDSFHLENAIANKVIVGLETNSYSVGSADSHSTDIYAHYKLDPNIRLIVGNRDYSNGPNKMFYGVGVNGYLSPKVEGYAAVTTSSIATEWQTGVAYNLDKKTSLHLGYKSNNPDNSPTTNGIGFGASYKF